MEKKLSSMMDQDRADRVDELVYELIGSLTLGQDRPLHHSTEIISVGETHVVARWRAFLIFHEGLGPDNGSLPGLRLADHVFCEQRTIRLSWKDAASFNSLSNDCDFEWVEEDNDIEESIPWDSPDLPAQFVERAMADLDLESETDNLIEHYGSTEEIDFSIYPQVLQPYLRAMIVSHNNRNVT